MLKVIAEMELLPPGPERQAVLRLTVDKARLLRGVPSRPSSMMMGLADSVDRAIDQLSEGEQRRALLASLLSGANPDVPPLWLYLTSPGALLELVQMHGQFACNRPENERDEALRQFTSDVHTLAQRTPKPKNICDLELTVYEMIDHGATSPNSRSELYRHLLQPGSCAHGDRLLDWLALRLRKTLGEPNVRWILAVEQPAHRFPEALKRVAILRTLTERLEGLKQADCKAQFPGLLQAANRLLQKTTHQCLTNAQGQVPVSMLVLDLMYGVGHLPKEDQAQAAKELDALRGLLPPMTVEAEEEFEADYQYARDTVLRILPGVSGPMPTSFSQSSGAAHAGPVSLLDNSAIAIVLALMAKDVNLKELLSDLNALLLGAMLGEMTADAFNEKYKNVLSTGSVNGQSVLEVGDLTVSGGLSSGPRLGVCLGRLRSMLPLTFRGVGRS